MFIDPASEPNDYEADYLPVPLPRDRSILATGYGRGGTPVGTTERSTGGSPDRLALSVPEAARLLGISRTLAYELVAEGAIPSVRFGSRIVVPKARLIALLEAADS
jgi:excisionase family DNA binding protein